MQQKLNALLLPAGEEDDEEDDEDDLEGGTKRAAEDDDDDEEVRRHHLTSAKPLTNHIAVSPLLLLFFRTLRPRSRKPTMMIDAFHRSVLLNHFLFPHLTVTGGGAGGLI